MDWDKLIERKICAAQDAGEFDNLPHKGQLNQEDENSIPEDMRLAFHLLKEQGFAPDWIEQDKGMRAKLQGARQALLRSWVWRQNKLAQAATNNERTSIEQEWKLAQKRFRGVIDELNAEIFNYNLRVPSIQLQRRPLRINEEYHMLGIVAQDE